MHGPDPNHFANSIARGERGRGILKLTHIGQFTNCLVNFSFYPDLWVMFRPFPPTEKGYKKGGLVIRPPSIFIRLSVYFLRVPLPLASGWEPVSAVAPHFEWLHAHRVRHCAPAYQSR